MHKIIIQPGRYRGLCEVIVLQQVCFLFFKSWQTILTVEKQEASALTLFHETRKELKILKSHCFNWTDGNIPVQSYGFFH